MALPLVIIGVAAVAKATTSIWFGSRATSPLSEAWRRQFLFRSCVAVDKLESLKLATPDQVTSLRADLRLLKEHVSDGWSDTRLFDAATRVSWSMGYNHTVTGVKGVAVLATNYAALVSKSVSHWTDRFVEVTFRKPTKDPH